MVFCYTLMQIYKLSYVVALFLMIFMDFENKTLSLYANIYYSHTAINQACYEWTRNY